MAFSPGLEFVHKLDAEDPLARFRDQFHIPTDESGKPLVYLCGNSLGLQPKTTRALLEEELDDWKTLAVKGHFDARRPWMPYHEQLTDLTAELVGGQSFEVINMNTLTVNLHLMMVSFYRPTRERYKLLIEKPAFPSDRYAANSQVRFHGLDPADALLEIGPRENESEIREEDLYALIEREGKQIALIMLPGVQYYSGQAFDMAQITELGHAQGCVVGFDLAHAAGNLMLDLNAWNVDFAVWCNYKYLNSGPGSVAGCFVHAMHARSFELPRFAGWWGHDKASRFLMGPEFKPMAGAEGWQLSNPPILAMAPVLSSLRVFHEAGMAALRAKSEKLTAYLEWLLRQELGRDIGILTPRDTDRRGCQLSLVLRSGAGRSVYERLEASGVVCDWREPNVIRIAPVPLYNSYLDAFEFVRRLRQCLAGK